MEEGELSFYEVAHFFPDDVKLRGHDLVAFGPSHNKPSYSGVCKIVRNLALYLHITHLPAPDLLCLARRYIEELQLPGLCFIFYIFCIYFYVVSTQGKWS